MIGWSWQESGLKSEHRDTLGDAVADMYAGTAVSTCEIEGNGDGEARVEIDNDGQ